MFALVPSKCPRCAEMVDFLSFWKQVAGKYFHLCEGCCTDKVPADECLLIGFHYGYKQAKEDIMEFLKGK